jgi:chemosensory pili system protein ChpA (sensor histidine kinase/response regulator)
VAPAVRAATVLIVEDDPALRLLYEKVLTLEGYQVIAARDGIDALQCVERHPVDAVVLDLMMPRMDGRSFKRGFDAHAALRDVPVILITGHVAPDINPDDFACVLHKPVGIEELLKAVRNCLKKAGYP